MKKMMKKKAEIIKAGDQIFFYDDPFREEEIEGEGKIIEVLAKVSYKIHGRPRCTAYFCRVLFPWTKQILPRLKVIHSEPW